MLKMAHTQAHKERYVVLLPLSGSELLEQLTYKICDIKVFSFYCNQLSRFFIFLCAQVKYQFKNSYYYCERAFLVIQLSAVLVF